MMGHRYIGATEQDQKEMLDTIGVQAIDDLFQDIPEAVRFKGELNLRPALSELELKKMLTECSRQNVTADDAACFLGAGVYDHFIPSVVNHVISRSEFYTAYTPYQPEISQGELQAIFEFQSMIAELTGMDAANSSMYDGFTACAEAALMACSATRRDKVLISAAVHPQIKEILATYAGGQQLQVAEAGMDNGLTVLEQLGSSLDEQTAAVIIQYPNFFGSIEQIKEIIQLAHESGALAIVFANPIALGLLTPPGAFGADIVVGDAQPLGIPMAFGGPHCGFMSVTRELVRKMPGRIVGQTVDSEGKRGFVLTLQAREQHIRREKASSNICSNQALNALAASVYLSAMGRQGLKEAAAQCFHKAHALQRQLASVQGIEIPFSAPFYHEFVIRLPRPAAEANRFLLKKNIIGGLDLASFGMPKHMLVCVTEKRTREEMDQLVRGLEEWV
jgi:glycine dehydrogenase subunit 1